MSLGKAAVFKHIPVYYPNHVGQVGGAVGMIGGLGGFILPVAFGVLLDLTGIWTSCFALLFLLVLVALGWMHLAIRQMERGANRRGAAEELPEFPEMRGLGEPGRSEEHTSELQSLMRISYAVFCLKKKNNRKTYIL